MYAKALKKLRGFTNFIKVTVKINDIIIFIASLLSGRAYMFYNMSPFGTAVTMALMYKKYYSFAFLLPTIGALLSGRGFYVVKYILIYAFLGTLNFKKDIFENKKQFLVASALLFMIAGCIFICINDINLYDLIVLIIECVCALLMFEYFCAFVDYFNVNSIRRTMSKTEFISLSTVLLMLLVSVSDIYFLYDVTLSGIISVFIILFTALKFEIGVCTCSGVVLGVVIGMSNPQMLYCIGVYSVSAFFASVASCYKKTGVILAFLLSNIFVTFYINEVSVMFVNAFEIFVASIILYLIPYEKLDSIKMNLLLLMPNEKTKEIRRVNEVKKVAGIRLTKLAGVFTQMADILHKKNNMSGNIIPEKEERMLVENVAERVCKRCRNCKKCWIENYSHTYEIVRKLLRVTKTRGWAENYDLPSGFKNSCYNPTTIVLETNKVYELYRVNTVWENKVDESRDLISAQLYDMAEVVSSMSEDIQNSCEFESQTENEIINFLDRLGVKIKSVSVMKDTDKKSQVRVCVRESRNENEMKCIVLTAVEKILNKRMKMAKCTCINSEYNMLIKEREWFRLDTAVSRVRQKGEKKWGDSYAIINPGNGKTVVALSDGMGSGEEAAKESNETVNLLQSMLVAGIDKDTAVKLINSVLILKSYDEIFATLDMLIFDLFTGAGEFIKTGGAGSYIKKGKKVVCVRSSSLPTGIVGAAEPAKSKIKFSKDDVIVIASDGVTEVIRDDSWIREVLRCCDRKTAQQIADTLMERAIKLQGEHSDDMTVIVIKVEEEG